MMTCKYRSACTKNLGCLGFPLVECIAIVLWHADDGLHVRAKVVQTFLEVLGQLSGADAAEGCPPWKQKAYHPRMRQRPERIHLQHNPTASACGTLQLISFLQPQSLNMGPAWTMQGNPLSASGH